MRSPTALSRRTHGNLFIDYICTGKRSTIASNVNAAPYNHCKNTLHNTPYKSRRRTVATNAVAWKSFLSRSMRFNRDATALLAIVMPSTRHSTIFRTPCGSAVGVPWERGHSVIGGLHVHLCLFSSRIISGMYHFRASLSKIICLLFSLISLSRYCLSLNQLANLFTLFF